MLRTNVRIGTHWPIWCCWEWWWFLTIVISDDFWFMTMMTFAAQLRHPAEHSDEAEEKQQSSLGKRKAEPPRWELQTGDILQSTATYRPQVILCFVCCLLRCWIIRGLYHGGTSLALANELFPNWFTHDGQGCSGCWVLFRWGECVDVNCGCVDMWMKMTIIGEFKSNLHQARNSSGTQTESIGVAPIHQTAVNNKSKDNKWEKSRLFWSKVENQGNPKLLWKVMKMMALCDPGMWAVDMWVNTKRVPESSR